MAQRIVAVKCNDQGKAVAMKTEDGAIHALPLSIASMQAGDFLGVQAMSETINGGYNVQSSMSTDQDGHLLTLQEFE